MSSASSMVVAMIILLFWSQAAGRKGNMGVSVWGFGRPVNVPGLPLHQE
jgi:hypothetical protein